MDLKSAPLSDFTRPGERSLFQSDGVAASHEVKLNKVVDISGSDEVGAVKYQLLLDLNLDDMAAAMAGGYERYKISNLSIKIQSGSPLGTSSGALQMCYIPDPLNSNFSVDNLGPNLEKAVRQAGSKVVRPRENIDEVIPLFGTLYTKQVGTPRHWSFGSITFVVRSVPDAADYASFVVTLECTIQFIRTAQVDYNNMTLLTTVLKKATIGKDKVEVELGCEVPFNNCEIQFEEPLRVLSKSKVKGHEITQYSKLREAKLVMTTPTKGYFKQSESIEIIKLLDNLLSRKIKVSGNLVR